MRENVDFGIDLGTTNSAVAVMDGDRAGVLRDAANAEFTPSVVHVSRSGNVLVGSSVVAKTVTDPANTAAEFKLRMGRRDDTVLFEASGTTMSPEELSAQVLMSLRDNASVALGEPLQAAVITVPAAFTMDQHAATMRAAELAGIRHATLLQEPTAAAWAYLSEQRTLPDKAFWLVYDFGGGTFDAAVVKIEQGEFSVVTHAGDNALGGKRIDWALVDEVLRPALHAADPTRPVVSRDNPRTVGALARLKGLAESIKIQLAARTEVLIEDDIEVDGVDVPFSCTVTREQLDAVARELVAASVRHCRKALADARLDPSDVSRVLLVGGTSKMVLVRELLGELGIPLDHGQDPITVVARGAAYYAATVRRPRTDDDVAPAGTVRLHLDVPAAGQDDDPLAGGRAELDTVTDWAGWTVELRSTDAATGLAWTSGKVALDGTGVFRTRLQTLTDGLHEFTVVLRDPTGTETPTDSPTTTHRRLAAKGDGAARAVHTVGVGLANNEVQVLVAQGDELPSTGRAPDLRTSGPISHADGGVLRIPILEGNHERADRNRVVGVLDLRREDFTRDVPAGSEVEVELTIDASFGTQGGTAYFPLLDQEFPIHVDLGRSALPPVEELEEHRAALGRRYDDLRAQAAGLGPEAAAGLDRFDEHGYLAEADRLLRQAAVDPDAVATCHDFLLEVESALDEAEAGLDLPRLADEARSAKATASEIVSTFGTREQQAELSKAQSELDTALVDGDRAVIERRIDEVWAIAGGAIPHDARVRAQFAGLEESLAGDPRPEVGRLLTEGRLATVRGDVATLERVVAALRRYVPAGGPDVGPAATAQRPGVVGVERGRGR